MEALGGSLRTPHALQVPFLSHFASFRRPAPASAVLRHATRPPDFQPIFRSPGFSTGSTHSSAQDGAGTSTTLKNIFPKNYIIRR